jgi:hypothetical protein
MHYSASKTRSLNIAFVVDAELLRSLVRILHERSEALEYTVKFSDGVSVRYRQIEEVIGQPNSSKRSIVSIIVGTAGDEERSAFVNLKANDFPSVEYTVTGMQRDVIYFADKLDEWVAAARQSYSWLVPTPDATPSFGSAVLMAGVIFIPMFLVLYMARWWPAVFSKAVMHGFPAGAALVALYTAEYWIAQMFPRGTFAVGGGQKKHQAIVVARWTILVGIAVSILAGIIANAITRHI